MEKRSMFLNLPVGVKVLFLGTVPLIFLIIAAFMNTISFNQIERVLHQVPARAQALVEKTAPVDQKTEASRPSKEVMRALEGLLTKAKTINILITVLSVLITISFTVLVSRQITQEIKEIKGEK